MNGYTPKQQEYINSVDGNAHMSAVEIIRELEERHTALVEAVAWHLEILATRPKEVEDCHGFCADEKDMLRCDNQQVEHEILRLCARAEVDRLIVGEGAADCEEGG